MANPKNQIALAENTDVYASEFSSIIASEETAKKLANIKACMMLEKASAYKLAYYVASVTDEEARKETVNGEVFKTATAFIEKMTGLKKSMISNYRVVGRMLTDDNGNFIMPDEFKGFTVTQLLEARAKVNTTDEVKEAITSGEIICTMSAKDIREALSTQEEKDLQKARTEQAVRNAERKKAVDFGKHQGAPVKVGEEVVGYIIPDCPLNKFAEYLKSGFAYIETATGKLDIKVQ